mgnify:FL=1
MPKKLDRRLLKQTLYGYQLVNRFTEAERRSWLEHLSLEEARQIFDDLHQNADDWKKDGGDLETLERRRLAGKMNGRRINLLLAKKRGLV